MVLSKATLEAELLKIFDPPDPKEDNFPQTVDEFAAAFTAAYDTYSATAEDASKDNPAAVNSTAMETKLKTLKAGDAAQGVTAADAAAIYAGAWKDYWTGVAFNTASVGTQGPPPRCSNVGGNGIFGSETTSVVTMVTETTLQSQLQAEFEDRGPDDSPKTAAQAASNIAQIFHDATTTDIMVKITGFDTTPPLTGPLAISNDCTVF